MADTIEAIVIQKIATPAEWATDTRIPYKGEVLLVGDSNGKVVNIKIGDGANTWSNLDYMFDSIQQNVNYYPVSGLALPTPVGDNVFSLVVEGTYTFGGVEAFTVTEGNFGIIYWNGTTWSLVDMGKLPMQEGVDEIDPDGDSLPKEKAVPKYINKVTKEDFTGGDRKLASANSAKTLNDRTDYYDRPDLADKHYLLSNNNKVISELVTPDSEYLNMFLSAVVDRPDLGDIIVVDKNGNLISTTNPMQISRNVESKVDIPFYNPPEQSGFTVPPQGDDSILGNYEALITAYDEIMSHGNNNTNIDPYITKESIGTGSVEGQDIYKYSLTPPGAKFKILLISGEHATEKMYIHCIHSFIKDLVENWTSHPFLDYLRWNVQIDVLPCRIPYALSSPVRKLGTRTAPETDPIPISWTKSGSTVTVNFNINDFPTNEILTGSNYFSAAPASALINRTVVGIRTSSDELGLPRQSYRIAGVINGQTITVIAPEGGATSGTGTLQVWADPNRNLSFEDETGWNNFSSDNTDQIDDDGYEYTKMTNKGTRPFSLKENRRFIELIEREQYDYVLSGHSPGGDNYISYNSSTGFVPNIDRMLAESGAFVNTGNRIFDRATDNTPWTVSVVTIRYNTHMHTPEWGSGLNTATPTQVRDALRWMIILIKDALTKIVNR